MEWRNSTELVAGPSLTARNREVAAPTRRPRRLVSVAVLALTVCGVGWLSAGAAQELPRRGASGRELPARNAKVRDARAARPAPAEDGWRLAWAEEFEGTRLNKRRWQVGAKGKPNYDGGINQYDPQDVYLEDGNLVLRSRALGEDGGEPYSSGRVRAKPKFAFLYGRLEVRAKLPGTKGMWPAIWLLPRDGSWPPEIDVMEMLGDDPRRVYMTMHWGPRDDRDSSQGNFTGPDFTSDFHVFSIEWEPGRIRWLIDGVERHVETENVPNKAMYLIMNTSVGGEWPGDPDERTVFPQYFQIDYVRVYQQPGVGGRRPRR